MTTARLIGIAGLGLLGSALAHRLIGAGFSPKGFDIDAAKTAAFATKLRLSAEPAMPRFYIYARKAGIGDNFRQFYQRAQREGWRTYEIDASHNPHITNPQALFAILTEIAAA